LKAVLKVTTRLYAENSSPHHGYECSNTDGRIAPKHAKGASYNNGIRDMIGCTHPAGQSDDEAANAEAKEDDRDRLSSSESK
jgi:hypothetical protein